MRTLLHFCSLLCLAGVLAAGNLAAFQPDGRAVPVRNDTRSGTVGEIDSRDLPPEAREVLTLIRRGGPFPYSQDGIVFSNREHVLAAKPRGYYHEYTVPTPRARNRGARRIIAGAGGEFFYTDDHYATFRRIKDQA